MKKVQIIILSFLVGFFASIPAYGSGKIAQIRVPDSLLPGLQHLLALADPHQRQQFNSARITEILKFIETSKHSNTLYYTKKKTAPRLPITNSMSVAA
jgi:hypothetical protein